MKELEFKEELNKVDDDTYIFSRIFKSELSKDDCLKLKTGAEKNIIRLKEELEKNNEEHIQMALKELYDSIDEEVILKKEALKNWAEYEKKMIREFKIKSEARKKEFKDFLNIVDKIKEDVERRTRELAEKEKEQLNYQLKDEEKVVEVYKEVEE